MRDRSGRVGTLVFGVVLAFGVLRAEEPAQAPHIKFDSEQADLGDIVHGQDAVATFTYRNTGTVPLHILAAKPG